MGDHFALLVDRLLTESTLEATIGIGSRVEGQVAANPSSLEDQGKEITRKRIIRDRTSIGKLVECRICQEEDDDFNMEIPCSCRGSLKYAHRKCVQRWCNEKGDTVCEICLQQFKPGYTAPPKLFRYGTTPMNFRGNWEITRQDIYDSQIITLVPSERDTLQYYDNDHSSSKVCCRVIALIFMVLLVLQHFLPLLIGGAEQYSFTLFSLMVLRTTGILLPVLVILQTVRVFHQCRDHQVTGEITDPSGGSNLVNSWHLVQPYSHRIQMH
ncbi:uncharacterized protein LOC121981911 isoform X1 [Zingiber officinale]|uniref:uncharacterized protein LOC121981911 isoform X1 n=1 Tax=Zingiber officinale TaxID=94328 RepID=UPI001C4AD8E1|nr:uncharacterized protein LOC121981911 isoform X1 [Zingiber officinale]XP_042390624.1 uncharacterized protein LOC121981911 isoform X1 [Zingiber officinale]XP_042390625.1 uncharacterized protein LOC121981911 isoform X1 [Zingiber officinale]XP_042390626.1 uncharacterized protein LOC121981911 isoform X1 [Zingiber officinale]XP_042390627.1 uncharacterized protein LOC121981911 isoform X1 [Zingiber officinale]